MKPSLKLTACILSAVALFTGCKEDEPLRSPVADEMSATKPSQNHAKRYDSYIAQSWYKLMFRLIKETPGHTPPIAARTFGYSGVALYETLAGETPRHQSLAGQLNELNFIPQRAQGNSYSAPIAANAALARIIKLLFQNASEANKQKIDSLEAANETMYPISASGLIINRSRDYGRSVAAAVFDWSRSDGGHEAYLNIFPSGYVPPQGEDKWIPTPPQFQHAMLPYWGNNRVMVAANAETSIDPPAPPFFSTAPSSSFYQAALEVYEASNDLSDEQRTIGLYWNDGAGTFTPPGHNIAITLQLIDDLDLNLNQAATILAKVGIALNDASVVCWRAKYVYNLLRPVSFIHQHIDASWTPLITTPPFPAYISGHSSFSAATAGVLITELGNGIAFTDWSKVADGFAPRSFSSIDQYAQEAAVSRLYGGIHYYFDNDEGYKCGRNIASNIEQLNL